MKKNKLLNTEISTGTYLTFTDRIIELARSKKGGYVCFANVHMLIEAYDDPGFSKVVNNADIVTPDGKPICTMLKILYRNPRQRVAGMDLLPDLLEISEKEKLSVFFYGSTPESLRKIELKIREDHPLLKISGIFSPPFGEVSSEELKGHINMINEKDPDIIFISLGCPKQEKRMSDMSGKLNGVMIGIGGAVPVLAGDNKRAPVWMQASSLEWLYRLIQEPRRLWKRYLYTNFKFIYLMIREIVRLRILKKGDSL